MTVAPPADSLKVSPALCAAIGLVATLLTSLGSLALTIPGLFAFTPGRLMAVWLFG